MKNQQQRRKEIEHFCIDFFQGNNKKLYTVVEDCKHMLTQIDIRCLTFTKYTFEKSFQRICKLLFIQRPATNAYIIAMLGFAVEVNEYLYDCLWYNIDILINSMTNVLEETDFNPKLLTKPSNFCILL